MKKAGILGFAHGHVFQYAGVWAKDKSLGIELDCCYDHDAARCAESAEKLGIGTVCASVEEVLARDIDFVVVSSETYYHPEYVIKAAEAGKDIICYKPLALRMADADRMAEAVKNAGVRFTVGYQMRSDPQNQRIKQLIDENTLGKAVHFRRRHGLATHTWGNFEATWHNSYEMNRDIFADDSSHPLDLVQWFFGMPESVTAELTTALSPAVPNDNGTILLRYPSGLLAEVSCCFTCVAAEATTELFCENGSAIQSYGDAVSTGLPRPADEPGLRWHVRGSGEWVDSGIPSPAAHGERLAWQAKPFADFIYGRRGPICSMEEACNDLRLVLACYVSSNEGRRVSPYDQAIYNI